MVKIFESEYLEKIIPYCLILLTFGSFVTFGTGNIGQILCLLVMFWCFWHRMVIVGGQSKNFVFVYLLWALAVLFSTLYSDVPLRNISRWANRYVWVSLPFFLMLVLLYKEKWGKYCLAAEILSITITCGLLAYQGITTHQRAGAIINANVMEIGSILVVALPLIFICFMDERIFGKWRWFVLPMFLVCNLGLLYNQTRGAWITCSLMYLLIFIFYFKRNKKITVIVLAGIILTGIFMSANPMITKRWTLDPYHSSNASRVRIWTAAYNMWKDNPIIGVGYQGFKERYQKRYILHSVSKIEKKLTHAHNNMMMILAEQGIVGLSFFLLCYVFFVCQGWKNYRTYHDPYSLMTVVITAGTLVHGMTECNLHMPFFLRIYWLLQGIAWAMHIQWRNKNYERSN